MPQLVNPDPQFLRRAIELAVRNVESGSGGPFGAVVVRDGVVVAEAANSVTATDDPTAHAEVNAIRLACRALGSFQLAGCVVYSSAEPCPMCLSAIWWARCDGVVFGSGAAEAAAVGFDDARLYQELRLSAAERTLPAVQLRLPESGQPFALWSAAAAQRIDY